MMPQNHNSTPAWTPSMHQDPVGAGMSDEDFTKFLDLDNGFEQFPQMDGSDGHSSLETPMGRLAFGANPTQHLSQHDQGAMQNIDISVRYTNEPSTLAPHADMRSNSYQQYQQYQMYQQMNQAHHYQVPPTPVSAEMHAAKYSGPIDSAGQMIFDRHQASFTPLVSPAQTPLDTGFCMSEIPDYMVADEFFSPLTSPAIEAQASFMFSGNSSTASPIDLNVDQTTSTPSGPATRRRARKANPVQPKPPRSVKQSPAMKPQSKRRQFSISSITPERLETMLEKTMSFERLQPEGNRANTFASSEDSVSPEPLSEALMRPPPMPTNLRKSPSTLHPQSSEQNLPATPAMIMRIPNKQPNPTSQPSNIALTQDFMEDISLPDAVTIDITEQLPQITVRNISTEDQSTPTLTAKTAKLSADNTPRISAIKAQSDAVSLVDKAQKTETKAGGRSGKKRQSVSTSAMSPALRPKISPSISPLVPAPGPGMASISAETNALFLASKSNYQNILDGTHLPGVSYPEALAENLSSKRTSHKLAEQGRRNRINLALKEIEALLPSSITAGLKKEKSASSSKDSEDGSPDKPTSAAQSASKASTVEMAIVYIRSLQEELQQTKEKLEAAEKTITNRTKDESASSDESKLT